jgi:hypothetical protein
MYGVNKIMIKMYGVLLAENPPTSAIYSKAYYFAMAGVVACIIGERRIYKVSELRMAGVGQKFTSRITLTRAREREGQEAR